MTAMRRAGTLIALLCGFIVTWCVAVIGWDDNWGESITEWHLFAVATAALGGMFLGLMSAARGASLGLVGALALGVGAALGAIFIVGGT